MKRSSTRVLLTLCLLASACAHRGTSGELFGAPTPMPAPEEARISALEEPHAGKAADLAWIAANDRKLARERIDGGLRHDPSDASLRLRRALLALAELAPEKAHEDLLWILRHDPSGATAEIALEIMLVESSLASFVIRPETLEALDTGMATSPARSPTHAVLAAKIRAVVARFRNKATSRVAAEEEAKIFEAAGAVSRFRSRGPLAPWIYLSLEAPTAWERAVIESPDNQAVKPPLPPGAFERELELRGGLIDAARDQPAGLYVSEAYFEVPGPETRSVRLWANLRVQARLHLDGQFLLERLETEAELPEVLERSVELAPGWHQIVIASLSAPRGGFALHLFDESGRPIVVEAKTALPPGARLAAASPGPPIDPRPAAVRRVARALKLAEDAPSVRLWTGRLALGTALRDLELARIALSPGARLAPHSAAFAAGRARVAQQEGQARALVEAELRRGLELDATEPSLLESVARSTGQDQPDRALQLIERLRQAAPDSSAADELAFHIHVRRGWNQEAEAALLAAEAKGASPALLDAGAMFLRAQFRLPEAKQREKAAQRLRSSKPKKNATRDALENGDPTRAIELLEKSLSKSADPASVLRRIAELQLQRGAWDEAANAAARLEALSPWSAAGLELAAAAGLGAEDTAAVLDHLSKLRAMGLDSVELESVRAEAESRVPGLPEPGSALAARLAFDPLALAREPVRPDELGFREVQLLDRVVDYVGPSGQALSLRHAVTRLLNKEATDRAGEFKLSADALALELRTLKSDGRIIEIDEHEGKEDLSFSALAPGDTVERKWLVVDGPATYFGGYANQFFFRDDVPTQRAEYFVVVPKGTKVQWRSYNGAPEAEIIEDGDRTIYAFQRRGTPGMRLEPRSVEYEEYVPFVDVSVGLDRETASRANRARLFGAGRSSHEVAERAQALTAGTSDPRVKLERLFRFAVDEIRPGSANDPAVTLSLGRGNRLFLLAALTRSAGLDAELVLARAGQQARLEPPMIDANFYSLPLLRVQLPSSGENVFAVIGASSRSGGEAWLGAAPASFHRGSYIRSRDPSATPIPFGETEVEANRTETKVQLAVRAGGNAEGTISLSVPGSPAAQMKEALRPLRAHELRQALQGLLASTVPGAQLVESEIDGMDDQLSGVVIRMKVIVHAFLTPENGSMVANLFFPKFISGLFAGLTPFEGLIQVPERESPMLLPRASETLSVQIEMPQGTPAPSRAPESFERIEPWGRVRQTAKYEGRVLNFERAVEMHGGRVSPTEYPAFFGTIQELALRMRSQLRFDPAPKATAGR